MSKSPASFSDLDSLLDKATNPMQLEPDSESVKQICYAIGKGVIESTYAVQALYGKMTDENPHTVLFALRVLEKIFYDCGNLAHRVICTENFMSLLKDIVQTTEHKLIRDKILELVQTWADTFTHLPQYSAPKKLLEMLQADGFVFPCLRNNVAIESKKQQRDNNTAVNFMHEKKKSVNEKALKQYDCNNKDSGIDSDTDMKNREDSFMKNLREIQEKKKRDFKQHQKSLGLPTSSDEEENGNVSAKQESQLLPCEENYLKSYALPVELKKVKESRQAVDRELLKYRNSKKEEFKQKKTDENGGFNQILQLKDSEDKCSTCEMYRKKCNHDVTFERSTPRLHPDLRKVKESREIIKNSFEEVKMKKKQEYYAKKSNVCVDSSISKSDRNKISNEIENHQLQRSLEVSQTDNDWHTVRKPRTRARENEELEEALRLSLLQAGQNSSSEDNDLQRAIDMSIADAEKQSFSALPKLGNNDDDSVLLSYITELSLSESTEEKHTLGTKELYAEYDAEPCIICRDETKFLKSFKPCNHRCICNDCSKVYNSQWCPLCRAYYSSITF